MMDVAFTINLVMAVLSLAGLSYGVHACLRFFPPERKRNWGPVHDRALDVFGTRKVQAPEWT